MPRATSQPIVAVKAKQGSSNVQPVQAVAAPTGPKKRKAPRVPGGARAMRRQQAQDAKAQRLRNDDRVIREALQEFFGVGRGRPEETTRRIRDTIVTVLALNEKVDPPLLARFLNLRVREAERRLKSAHRRITRNADLPRKEWVWADKPQQRSDTYSADRCSDACAFWRHPSVSKEIHSKRAASGGVKFQQYAFLKVAHEKYIAHKRATDPEFSCSITWFSKQRPSDVRKLATKPTSARKGARPDNTAMLVGDEE